MTASQGAARLYTPEILGLAVELADYPITEEQVLRANVRSRSCGSTLAIAIEPREDSSIQSIGLQVSACATGQASAAIFAKAAKGTTKADLQRAMRSLEVWLANGSDLCDWPSLALLTEARAYPARHEAIMLPWRAAVAALSKGETDG
ncbi:iron-sulfur cluster assembly scaffold protein [Pontixanthobacter sp. CEM42]|uniref:iron-sulfur cluster assembly scaffold protein n=1 Tax=Pontixanthobacter sp. CEM42 TaxID=2792077 RepID=UPI001ADF7D8D|nr:iron-sulfur cluster assembly scaffold protein [Pontixanthobacter sp. CEM42]